MPTGRGRTIDKKSIITTYGCKHAFKNTFKSGTKIWIFYDDSMDIVKIEHRTNEHSPENNPKIKPSDAVVGFVGSSGTGC